MNKLDKQHTSFFDIKIKKDRIVQTCIVLFIGSLILAAALTSLFQYLLS